MGIMMNSNGEEVEGLKLYSKLWECWDWAVVEATSQLYYSPVFCKLSPFSGCCQPAGRKCDSVRSFMTSWWRCCCLYLQLHSQVACEDPVALSVCTKEDEI